MSASFSPRWALFSLLLAGCSALTPPVARTVDGITTEGRFIEPEAYALYSVAALREAHGQHREALELYQRALRVDTRGPEIRTRIAAVACKLRDHRLADRSFAAALDRDPEYGPAWFELALCRKARGDLPAAADAAQRALELDPERYETSLLAADVAEQRGDHATAWRLRDALVTHAPGSLQVQRAVLDAAQRAREPARAARVQQALDQLAQRGSSRPPGHGLELALQALARGDVTAARAEAELLLGADPSNGDALVVALAAADLAQDHAGFARLLETATEPGRPASAAVLETLEALVARRVSAQAAQLLRPQ